MFPILKKTRIDYPGLNMALIPYKSGYIGTMRRINPAPPGYPKYPELFNETHVLEMDDEFHILSTYILDESVDWGIQKHVSFCCGAEDCRFIDDTHLICVAHGTNPHWITKQGYFEFSHEEKRMTRFLPLRVEGRDMDTEKNWLFLRRADESHLHFLHWYNPFEIVELDTETGVASVFKSYQIPGLNWYSHGGASLFIEFEQKYLVTVRNYDRSNKRFLNNTWLLFDTEYNLCGVSEGFIFDTSEYGVVANYQMIMSLFLKDDVLYASTSSNDILVVVFQMKLLDVLATIRPI